MDVAALEKMFSSQSGNRKGKAKRRLRQRKPKVGDKPPHPRVDGNVVDYDKPLFVERREIKIGPYFEHELADVSDGNSDEDGGKYESIELANGETENILFRHPDDDEMIEFNYYTEVGGEFKGLSEALVANSFEIGTEDHKKRFKRVLDWQLPQEEEFLMENPSLEKYHSEVLMTAMGRVVYANFSV